MDGLAPILIGLALLAVAWVCWTGRWRGWAKVTVMPQMPITLLPAVAAMFVLLGVAELVEQPLRGICFALVFVVLVTGFVLAMWGPEWYGPRWYRERDRDYDLSVALNAAIAASVRTDPGPNASEAVARERMSGREPDARWGAYLVTDAHGRPSAMQRKGHVRGHLLLYPEALVFAAAVGEDRMRGRPVVEVIPARDIRAVRVVPPGSRADGSRSRADLPAWIRPRLRLETASGPVVLETASAGARQRELEARYLGAPVA
jgi:hypothetical protein